MSESRQKMNKALKDIVLPALRKKGFKGSFNHFRRINNNSIDLLTFQFSYYGGEFCMDIAKCSLKGVRDVMGKKVPPNKVTAFHVNPPLRPRLTPNMNQSKDKWFNFGDPYKMHGDIRSSEEICQEVLALINNEAEKWWIDKKHVHKQSL